MSQSTIRSICVFCGAGSGSLPAFTKAAAEMGNRIAASGIRLVYGGGSGGLMGALADGALGAGGTVIGVIPRFLVDRETAHGGVTELQIVEGMHERKRTMFELADAFVALPGGLGTLDETLEIITWRQLGRHKKPVLIVNTNDYWSPFLLIMEHVTRMQFAHGDMSTLYRIAKDPEEVLRILSC